MKNSVQHAFAISISISVKTCCFIDLKTVKTVTVKSYK